MSVHSLGDHEAILILQKVEMTEGNGGSKLRNQISIVIDEPQDYFNDTSSSVNASINDSSNNMTDSATASVPQTPQSAPLPRHQVDYSAGIGS